MEDFFQEAGRCGRGLVDEGAQAEVIVLWCKADTPSNLADDALRAMSQQNNECRHLVILRHFLWEPQYWSKIGSSAEAIMRSVRQGRCCDVCEERRQSSV
jgi:hypothetical protein